MYALIFSVLFIIECHKYAVHHRRRRIQPLFVAAILLMYICATLHLAVRWWWVRNSFITHGATPQDVISAFMSPSNRWMWAISGVSASLLIGIADVVLIWRCWIVWFRDLRVIVLPCMTILMGWVFNGLFLWQDITHDSSNAHLNWGIQAVNWGVAFFACSLGTTLICTTLIIYRILAIARLGIRSYSGVIEVLVESAAIYALSLIVFLAFLVRDDPGNVYPQALLISSAGIAPTLIVARIVSGNARSDDSWGTSFGGQSRSELNFARRTPMNVSINTDTDVVTDEGHSFKSKRMSDRHSVVVEVDVMELTSSRSLELDARAHRHVDC